MPRMADEDRDFIDRTGQRVTGAAQLGGAVGIAAGSGAAFDRARMRFSPRTNPSLLDLRAPLSAFADKKNRAEHIKHAFVPYATASREAKAGGVTGRAVAGHTARSLAWGVPKKIAFASSIPLGIAGYHNIRAKEGKVRTRDAIDRSLHGAKRTLAGGVLPGAPTAYDIVRDPRIPNHPATLARESGKRFRDYAGEAGSGMAGGAAASTVAGLAFRNAVKRRMGVTERVGHNVGQARRIATTAGYGAAAAGAKAVGAHGVANDLARASARTARSGSVPKAITRATKFRAGIVGAAYGAGALGGVVAHDSWRRSRNKGAAARPFGKSVMPGVDVNEVLRRKERDELQRRKKRQRVLSQTSGVLGLAALGTRVPGAAAKVKSSQRAFEMARRIAPKASGASNVLTTGAVGAGAFSSLNFARQTALEQKADKKAINISNAQMRKSDTILLDKAFALRPVGPKPVRFAGVRGGGFVRNPRTGGMTYRRGSLG